MQAKVKNSQNSMENPINSDQENNDENVDYS